MSSMPDEIEIDFLILADKAEVVNGKLYMMGGAWDRRRVNDFSQPILMSMVVGILVPWNLTNEAHHIQIALENEDGSTIQPSVQANFTVGRPTNARRGQSFRAMVAIDGMRTLPGPGTYRFVATIGDTTKTTTFFAEQQGGVPNPPEVR